MKLGNSPIQTLFVWGTFFFLVKPILFMFRLVKIKETDNHIIIRLILTSKVSESPMSFTTHFHTKLEGENYLLWMYLMLNPFFRINYSPNLLEGVINSVCLKFYAFNVINVFYDYLLF